MPYDDLPQRLDRIRARIADACASAHRDPSGVGLIAVSKFHPAHAVEKALESGQRLFGENRIQEAASKFPALRERWPDLKLHIIGSLQTNKALEACRMADTIESVDRPSLVDALTRASDRLGSLPQLYIQINTGNEPQKSGARRNEADAFIALCKERFGTRVIGLMCIPPEEDDSATHFGLLASLARDHGLDSLSMGMSSDFETAIAQGATLVRVGTAIFGNRTAPV